MRRPTTIALRSRTGMAGLIVAAIVGACASSTGTTVTTDAAAQQSTDVTAEVDPATALGTYLEDPSPKALAEAVAIIEDGPGAESLADLLTANSATLEASPGRTTIAAPIGFNQHRQVTIRTPDGYDPGRPWPLIVAYHSWGGSADRMIDRLEEILGDDLDRFVVAAPDDYRQTVLDAPPPVSAEHVSIWREVATRRHIDSDRVFTMGYSLGGDTAITTAAFHGHRLAGAVGWAASPAFPGDVTGMFEWFAPNLGSTSLLHVWGAEDDLTIPGLNFRRSPRRLNELDREFATIAADVPGYSAIEIAGADHGSIRPPLDTTLELLDRTRGPVPTSIVQLFRYIHQADTAWVEGHEWWGEAWLTPWPIPEMEAGSLTPDEEATALRSLLGSIEATARDNVIDVVTTHLSDLTIWLPDGLADFDRPITVIWNGAVVFDGIVDQDLAVALVQADRTRDHSRLRWAGIRIVDGVAHIVDVQDTFPPVARGVVIG
jgi:predicted esterase